MATILDFPKLKDVTLTDAFWEKRYHTARTVTIYDTLKKFIDGGMLKNYDAVAQGLPEKHIGYCFFHGLFCEAIRGASDLLIMHYDPKLDAELDEIITHIQAAQNADPDGWLNPFMTLDRPNQRWGLNGGDAGYQHELYNAGTLAEAGMHHYIATGKTTLLRCAVRMSNYIASFIGEPPKHSCIPGHALAEQAYVNFARFFDEHPDLTAELGAQPAEYRRVAEFWINARGHHEERYQIPNDFKDYAQDHLPVREQTEAVGHAVRATLFYAGIESVANAVGDDSLHATAETIWKDITETKMHINGCVGADHRFEAFGAKYELPNNAYLETCAGVGLIFFALEHFRYTHDASVFDIIENTYYNTVLASVSEQGDTYFYQNPLISDGTHVRWAWHDCPCCPPMYFKALGILPQLIYTVSDGTIRVNLYIESTLRQPDFTLTYQGGALTLTSDQPQARRVLFRIPNYARNFRLTSQGAQIPFTTEQGYAAIDMTPGVPVEVVYDTPILAMTANPKVPDDLGKIAVMRAGILYCAEGVDNGGEVDFSVSGEPMTFNGEQIQGKTTDGKTFTLIPYHYWDNRGATKMAVWLDCPAAKADSFSESQWKDHLYLPLWEF